MFRTIQAAMACVVVLFTTAGRTQADLVFVGQFEVGDGPLWFLDPAVLSARETAALLFGGNYTDYAISTNPNTTDPLTVNHMAWVDGYEDESFLFPNTSASEDFKVDIGPVGYNTPGDFSAFVHDHDANLNGPFEPGNNSGNNVNYVWRIAAPVPEPSSLVLFGIGMCIVGCGVARRCRRRLEKQQTAAA